MRDYDEALRLEPHSAPAHFNKGNLLLDLERLDEAVAAFDRAVQCNPDFTGSYINRGVAQHLLGYTDAAISDFDSAISAES